MQTRLLRLCAAALAVAGFVGVTPRASADTIINLEYKGDSGTSADVTVNGHDLGAVPLGQFRWRDTATDTIIKTFCAEVTNPNLIPQFDPPTAPFTVTDISNLSAITNPNQADAVRALYGNYYDFAADTAKDGKNAAFQIALWELLYDYNNPVKVVPPGGADNNFFANNLSADVKSDAEFMAGNLGGGLANYNASGYEIVALLSPAVGGKGNHGDLQDHITVQPKAVPAPPAFMLAGIGVLGLLGRARWNRKPATA